MRNTDPLRPVRGLSLYDWPESIDVIHHREFLVELARHFADFPAVVHHRAAAATKSKHFTVKCIEQFERKLAALNPIEFIGLKIPINNDRRNPVFSISIKTNPEYRKHHVQKDIDVLPLSKLVDHIRIFCRYLTPVYGFSTISPSIDSYWFHAGTSSDLMSREVSFRSQALGRSLGPTGRHHHANGKLLDVFELNLLSLLHLVGKVGSSTLYQWIKSGGHGDLVEVNESTTVWLVPEEVRDPIRARLWREGFFLDDILPDIWKLDLSHIAPA